MADVPPRPPHTGGRPTPEGSAQLDRHVLEVATALFIEQRFAATSLERIARVAGCSKASLYRRHASKEDLFTAVVAARGRLLLEETTAMEAMPKNPLEAMREITHFFLDFMLRPETLEAYRIVIADGHRIPSVVEGMMKDIAGPFMATIGRLLRAAEEAGQIHATDHEETTRVLMSLVLGWPLQNTMLRQNRLHDPLVRARFFDRAWQIFICGISTTTR
ncbi:TetR/AcrR family transcriptional regulator [Gluconacetobacter entanii]|uniref:TetR/AcrR family transcriptional regulator n=1 Tax=Gluconacetobacter entanii TaxID=108528 RepID=UPI001C932260|nr:TetR/AcrR family transcriptional regulator [Gluconacetobacter entanii]MBY4639619.1 TetR/AcrR family transcriptional regulator [Gluconacetobacter entanii]MCW4579283.1 TetR/AcrR family transcriptional regulator [Gluconacetobacter entanii]MCW4582670.1 TetR/AcrR family transcriptional regulator [Gluconacetobacter entanii]MCW4586067.1 TetR/AcrR family transcriptional regulator [Gluconacetobacter entanii]